MDNVMAYKSRLTYKEIEPAIKDFSMVPYSVIKGESLSLAAYNATGKRTSSDIDILVSRKNLQVFEKVLLSHNFIKQDSSANITEQRTKRALMLSGSHQTSPFYLQKGVFRLCIDLNFDIFWGEYTGKRIDIENFLSDAIDIEIYDVKTKALTPLKAMIQLVLHHYKDMNSLFLLATRKSIKHNMFKDVYYLLKNNTDSISIEKLYDISFEYEIIPFVYYIFYHTGLLFDDDLLKKYIFAFKTSEGEQLLNCYGLNEAERREWKYEFNTRLESNNLYDLIKDDLTQKDIEKIALNKKVFLGE